MKRNLLVLGAVAVCLCLATAAAHAQTATVVGSRHDMDLRMDPATTNGAVCVYCHTPHGGLVAQGPLWNRPGTTATYTVYTSPTLDMTPLATTAGVGSSLCMSCHDGSVAINVLVNAPTTQTGLYGDGGLSTQNYNAAGAAFGTISDAFDSADLGWFGTDLTDQHPIGMQYDNDPVTGDPDFVDLATADDTLPFYGGSNDRVECQTCHDVHEYTNVPFLRVSNDNSALCTTCHIK